MFIVYCARKFKVTIISGGSYRLFKFDLSFQKCKAFSVFCLSAQVPILFAIGSNVHDAQKPGLPPCPCPRPELIECLQRKSVNKEEELSFFSAVDERDQIVLHYLDREDSPNLQGARPSTQTSRIHTDFCRTGFEWITFKFGRYFNCFKSLNFLDHFSPLLSNVY